ncbi:hypothetical protein PoB_000127500 [Plakobranchus ocellatus]|uniref:Uncharacterized protein n=1 Tax=Plakobranchus ocellatus TaxID=259542 RepID=A0AAV3XWI2_9GAST|nr:hypothetical protein PoB_000127500 [Plakobranchus ocellatus]
MITFDVLKALALSFLSTGMNAPILFKSGYLTVYVSSVRVKIKNNFTGFVPNATNFNRCDAPAWVLVGIAREIAKEIASLRRILSALPLSGLRQAKAPVARFASVTDGFPANLLADPLSVVPPILRLNSVIVIG